jgi:hypothetical protein
VLITDLDPQRSALLGETRATNRPTIVAKLLRERADIRRAATELYGIECDSTAVDDLLEDVAARTRETRDQLMGRLIDEIGSHPDNRNSWVPLRLIMLWVACNENLDIPLKSTRIAIPRAGRE